MKPYISTPLIALLTILLLFSCKKQDVECESEPTISKGASSDVSTAMKQVPGGSVHGNGLL